MGNCLMPPSTAESGASLQPSKVVASRTSSSSVPFSSFTTCSVASTFTVPSYREKTYGDSFSTKTEEEILFASNSKAFTLNELKSATRNFRTESLIGEGGFGLVYKGWLDEQTLTPTRPGNGTMVAIKKLKLESFQGHKEWLTEVNYLGQLQHPNLVKLIGYCSEGENRLLVYEYMGKGSLENHLFKSASKLNYECSFFEHCHLTIAISLFIAYLWFHLLSRKCSATRLGNKNQSCSRGSKGDLVFAQSRVSSNISRC